VAIPNIDPPVLLSAVPQFSSITLTWSPPATIDPGDSLLFTLYRDGSYIYGGSDLTFVDADGLTPGHTYTYRVSMYDMSNDGSSDLSLPLQAALPSDSSPPSRPGSIAVSDIQGGVRLSWGASQDDRVVMGYLVTRNAVLIGTVAENEYVDRDLLTGVTYQYQIIASDSSGNTSDPQARFVFYQPVDKWSPLKSVRFFDREKWLSDLQFRNDYLSDLNAGKIWDTLPPSASHTRIRSAGAVERTVDDNFHGDIQIVAPPGAPVSLLSLDAPIFFDEHSNMISVAANSSGLAIIPFTYRGRKIVRVMAASPMTTGRSVFKIIPRAIP
jgi:hypothetical protein